jgi:hypothetical protein
VISIAALILVGCIYLVAIWRPAWAVAVVLTMFATEQLLQASSGIFRSFGSLANVCVGSVVLLSLGKSFLAGTLQTSRWINTASVLTLLLYGYAGFSWLWTASPEWLAEYIRWTSPYIIVTLALAPLLVRDIDDLREFRIAMLIVGSIVAVLIILSPGFELVNGRYVVNIDRDSRTNPLAIGALGGMLVLLSVLGPSSEVRPSILALRITAFFAGLGLGFMSGSRGEVLAAIVFAFLFLPVARRIKNFGQFVGTAIVSLIFVVGVYAIRSIFVSADNEDRWSTEGLIYGPLGRLENVQDLALLYIDRPLLWFTGIGSAAFHDLPTRSGDPYSHVLIADLIFELGVPGVVLGVAIFYGAFGNAKRLFGAVAADPQARAMVAFLAAFIAYEFALANKAGIIWAQYDLFFGLVLLGRLTALQSDADARAVAAGEFESSEGDEEAAFADDLADEAVTDSPRGSPSPGAA